MRKTTHARSPRLTPYETRIHLACMAGPDVEGVGYGVKLRSGAPDRLGKRLGVTGQAIRQAWNEGTTVAQVEDRRRRVARENPPAWALTPNEVDEAIARDAGYTDWWDRPLPVWRGPPKRCEKWVTREDLEDAFGPPLC